MIENVLHTFNNDSSLVAKSAAWENLAVMSVDTVAIACTGWLELALSNDTILVANFFCSSLL